MTHAELVERAERWLRGTMRCGVVLAEPSGDGEIPDALGWKNHHCYLVECKASVSDFRADAKKLSRAHGIGPGCCRFYFAPRGLLATGLIPDGWGLVEVAARVRMTRRPACRRDVASVDDRLRRELNIALSELRKVQILLDGGDLHPSKSAERLKRGLLRPAQPTCADCGRATSCQGCVIRKRREAWEERERLRAAGLATLRTKAETVAEALPA